MRRLATVATALLLAMAACSAGQAGLDASSTTDGTEARTGPADGKPTTTAGTATTPTSDEEVETTTSAVETNTTEPIDETPATTVGIPAETTTTTDAASGDGSLLVDEGPGGEPDYRYVIPFGAGEALDAGEPMEILPASLEVQVGEIVEIVNQDDRGHLVGPFFVGEGETLRQRFSSPGEFIGMCSVHPSGELRLIVRDT